MWSNNSRIPGTRTSRINEDRVLTLGLYIGNRLKQLKNPAIPEFSLIKSSSQTLHWPLHQCKAVWFNGELFLAGCFKKLLINKSPWDFFLKSNWFFDSWLILRGLIRINDWQCVQIHYLTSNMRVPFRKG